MTKPKKFDLVLTEKGRFAIAYALASFLACGMEYNDLLEYYIDTQAAFFMNNEVNFKEELETHGEDMIGFIGEMNKKLT